MNQEMRDAYMEAFENIKTRKMYYEFLDGMTDSDKHRVTRNLAMFAGEQYFIMRQGTFSGADEFFVSLLKRFPWDKLESDTDIANFRDEFAISGKLPSDLVSNYAIRTNDVPESFSIEENIDEFFKRRALVAMEARNHVRMQQQMQLIASKYA